MFGRDPDHDYFSSLFPVQKRGIYEIVQGLITTLADIFPSILQLFKEKESSRPLPEELVLEILRRLPHEHILNCRMVCKRWMSLTSTPLFHGLRLTVASPAILLQHYVPNNDLKLYYFDLIPDEPRIGRFNTTKLQPKIRHCVYGGTCNGLVLLRSWERFGTLLVSICNPLTGRERTLPPAKADYYLGFWFHPIKRDYFFLAYSNGHEAGGGLLCRRFEYKIFNLRGESTVIGWYVALPSDNLPINISDCLYFLLPCERPCQNCIMIFNTESEKMDFKAHPHYDHCHSGHSSNSWDNEDTCLLDVGGSLGFAHSCYTERSLQLWVLAECATWEWIPRYKINMNWHRSMGRICVLSVLQNGEMLVHFRYKGLFVLTLETRRIRKINISVDGPSIVAHLLISALT